MTGPLDGVRVVVLAGIGPVAFGAMLLADLGADVVDVRRPTGRPSRALELTDRLAQEQDVVRRGVRSVVLDLKSPQGVGAVLDLCEEADVLMEGYRPGVAERLGLGPEEVSRRNPALVFARLTGYGQTGPKAVMAGHDINYVAQSGLLHALAAPGSMPQPPLNLLGDYAGGGAIAALGIVAAVLEARRSGRGQVVDAAMVDGVALLTAKLQGLRTSGAHAGEPGSNHLDGGAPFYCTYRCADGRHLAVGALEADFYAEFVSRLGVDLAGWPAQDDRDAWPELRRRISAAVGAHSMAHWVAVFDGTDACVTPVLTFDEAVVDPHNSSRRTYLAAGKGVQPAPAPRFSRSQHGAAPPADQSEVALDDVLDTWRDNRRS